jgi:carboxypeptidase family protein
MKKTLVALIAGCALAAGTAAPVLCADIVGTVQNANGYAVPGVTVSTRTTDGQNVGTAITDSQGNYTIDGVATGLYYITLTPPPGSDLLGQSAASYVGDPGLTVNWGVAPGRPSVAMAMPGTTNSNPGVGKLAQASGPKDPPPGCMGMPGPPCGPKKSKKRDDD